MPSKQPVTPPTPRQVNRPLRSATKPLTEEMMKQIAEILDETETTRTALGAHLGQRQQVVSEWLTGSRASPGSEPTIAMLIWAFRQDSRKVLEFLSRSTRPRKYLEALAAYTARKAQSSN